MADIGESAPFTDPAAAISQGKRHLLVRDYAMAVTALAQACELLAEKHGDTADELGEAYLLYGRALLGLAREEAGVLGGAVPGSENTDEDEDGEDDEDKDNEKASDGKEEEDDEDEGEEAEEQDKIEDKKDEKKNEASESSNKKRSSNNGVNREKESAKKTENDEGKGEVAAKEKETVSEKKSEEKKEETKETRSEGKSSAKDDVLDESKTEKKSSEDSTEKVESTSKSNGKVTKQGTEGDKREEESVSKTESKKPVSNGTCSSSLEHNGDTKQNRHTDTDNSKDEDRDIDENEDAEEDENEEEINNLQVAWEVLELAKLVLLKRGPPGWKLLADSYRLLGEVAMEGGNHQGALVDLQGCLNLLQKIEPHEPRAIAEIHYQLGLAHSLANDFDASIEQFHKATSLLETRIKELEGMTEPPKSSDPFYTIEGEIQELKELLPEIHEKITDMRDFKQEACKLVIEGIKSRVSKENSDSGAGSSSEPSSSKNDNVQTSNVQKPATDITHLIRKKRKADEVESDVASPSKKTASNESV